MNQQVNKQVCVLVVNYEFTVTTINPKTTRRTNVCVGELTSVPNSTFACYIRGSKNETGKTSSKLNNKMLLIILDFLFIAMEVMVCQLEGRTQTSQFKNFR